MKMTDGIFAAILILAATGVQADQHGGDASDTGAQADQQMSGMAGHGGMTQDGPSDGSGMMGRSGMGGGMMPGMMVAMMDANGDGSLSLDEVLAVHERMFKMADADDDVQVNVEEIRELMSGGGMMNGDMMGENSQ